MQKSQLLVAALFGLCASILQLVRHHKLVAQWSPEGYGMRPLNPVESIDLLTCFAFLFIFIWVVLAMQFRGRLARWDKFALSGRWTLFHSLALLAPCVGLLLFSELAISAWVEQQAELWLHFRDGR